MSFLRRLIEQKVYKGLYVVMVLFSCVVLVVVHPHVNRESSEVAPYLIIDYICKGFFLLDLLL